ncbi:MAG: dihydrofolate reductase [Patescibacteria group bacterium]
MIISAIVATDAKGAIGKNGQIPWRLPAEQAIFKQTTMGHPMIMGRKTYESIGRALPGRTSIVITHQQNYRADGCVIVGSLEQALEEAKKAESSDEIFIIGGEEIYNHAMPFTDRIYLTKVHATLAGDKFFKFDPKKWRQVSNEKHAADEKNQYDYEFMVLERKK